MWCINVKFLTFSREKYFDQRNEWNSKQQLQFEHIIESKRATPRKIAARKFIRSWRGASEVQQWNTRGESLLKDQIYTRLPAQPCGDHRMKTYKSPYLDSFIVKRIAWLLAGKNYTSFPRDAWHRVRNTVYREYCTLQFEEFNSRREANSPALERLEIQYNFARKCLNSFNGCWRENVGKYESVRMSVRNFYSASRYFADISETVTIMTEWSSLKRIFRYTYRNSDIFGSRIVTVEIYNIFRRNFIIMLRFIIKIYDIFQWGLKI